MVSLEDFHHLRIDRREDHVTVVEISPRDIEPGEASVHAELARVWLEIAADPGTHVAVVTGTFGSSVDPSGMLRVSGDYDTVTAVLRQGLDIVHNLVNCDKPIVSAIRGAPARGPRGGGGGGGRPAAPRRPPPPPPPPPTPGGAAPPATTRP